MNWIPIKDILPDDVGEYLCKNEQQPEFIFPSFYTRNLKGEYTWLKPSDNLIITHWSNKPI